MIKSIYSLLIALAFINVNLHFVRSAVFGYRRNNVFHSSYSSLNYFHQNENLLYSIRGGAKSSDIELDDDEDDDDDDEEDTDLELENKSNLGNGEDNVDIEDDDEEEEDVGESTKEDIFDAPLASSAMKSASKTKERINTSKIESVNKAVNSKLFNDKDKSTTAIKKKVVVEIIKKKKTKSSSILRLPYIIRAFMNPFTVISMTKAYWSSLFNLNYLKNRIEPTQELRSALEEKAKKKGGGGGNSARKKVMKRGQSKSLSDLPQLSS